LKSPWTVSPVDLNVKGQCVEVWAEHPEGAAWACPHCLRGSWDEAWGIMERAVKRGRQRTARKVVRRIGVDEKAAAETVRRHIGNTMTYYQDPVTNAMSEGLNSKVRKVKSMACGFRNHENFKTAIYYCCVRKHHRLRGVCPYQRRGRVWSNARPRSA
jgi:hypothetical protein